MTNTQVHCKFRALRAGFTRGHSRPQMARPVRVLTYSSKWGPALTPARTMRPATSAPATLPALPPTSTAVVHLTTANRPPHQVFNEINCRRISDELNVFAQLHRSPIFIAVLAVTVGCQVIIIELLGSFFTVSPRPVPVAQCLVPRAFVPPGSLSRRGRRGVAGQVALAGLRDLMRPRSRRLNT